VKIGARHVQFRASGPKWAFEPYGLKWEEISQSEISWAFEPYGLKWIEEIPAEFLFA